jgi:hypothetical protein
LIRAQFSSAVSLGVMVYKFLLDHSATYGAGVTDRNVAIEGDAPMVYLAYAY